MNPGMMTFERAPALSVPLRFFMTAPVFLMAAGILVSLEGVSALDNRWSPHALALTHLLVLGFMLQVMLGAMFQFLPVAAGATLPMQKALAWWVHLGLSGGAAALASAFLSSEPLWFGTAAVLLLLAVGGMVLAVTVAILRAPQGNSTLNGIASALGGLAVTLILGVILAQGLGRGIALPYGTLVDIHLAWGLIGWGGALVATVGFIVVPMFQLTPPYPQWMTRFFPVLLIASLALWSAAHLSGVRGDLVLAIPAALLVGGFAVRTLILQQQSKRPDRDTTFRAWMLAMVSLLLATLLWFVGLLVAPLGEWSAWPAALAILVVMGFFMSAIIGMVNKIVTFLVWMRLQAAMKPGVRIPTMKQIIGEPAMRGQFAAHAVAVVLMLLASAWPELAPLAGLVMIVDGAWLGWNLLTALRVYHRVQKELQAV